MLKGEKNKRDTGRGMEGEKGWDRERDWKKQIEDPAFGLHHGTNSILLL